MANNTLTNNEELPLTTTGEPTDQLAPEETDDFDEDDDLGENDGLETDQSDFDNEPLDDDADLDEDEVKRLFPGEDSYSENDNDEDNETEEPYEGIRHGDDEDEGLVDDNMSGMPVIPSPS